MIRGIHHTAISTPDLERALAFYRDLLGFEVETKADWSPDTDGAQRFDDIAGLRGSAAELVMLCAGNARIELFEYSAPLPKPGDPDRPVCDHGITHICLEVEDIDAEYERLRAAGMRFHCPPQHLGGVSATYGRDPDGNVVELYEETRRSEP